MFVVVVCVFLYVGVGLFRGGVRLMEVVFLIDGVVDLVCFGDKVVDVL